MGFFRRFAGAMRGEQEFVIGRRNVERYRADPDSLEEILAEQRARGVGPARAPREAGRGQAEAEEIGSPDGGFLDGVAQVALAAGVGLLVAQLWSGRGERD